MAAPPLAGRVMRARHGSRCHLCRGPVLVGQRIARVAEDGRSRWPHLVCLVAAQRAAAPVVNGRPVETIRLPERLARL